MAELVRRALDATYRRQLRPLVPGFNVNVGLTRGPDPALVARYSRPPRRILD